MSKCNEVNQCWIDLLVTYGGQEECKRIIDYSKCVVFGIMKYRRVLRSRGVGNVYLTELDKLLTEKSYKALHSKLEYMFLEPITDRQFDFIIDRIERIENGLEKLYNRHIEYRGLRILSVIITL